VSAKNISVPANADATERRIKDVEVNFIF